MRILLYFYKKPLWRVFRGGYFMFSLAEKYTDLNLLYGKKTEEMRFFDEPRQIEAFTDQLQYYFNWIPEMQDNRARYLYKGWKSTREDTRDVIIDNVERFIEYGEADLDPKIEEFMNQLAFTYEAMFQNQNDGRSDQYVCMNVLSFPTTRKSSTISELNSLYIDLDYYNLDMTREQVLEELDKLVEDKKIPRPTAILKTRGISLIWLISPVFFWSAPAWRSMQSYLYEQLKHLGADTQAKDASRFLRTVGSIHSKTDEKVIMDIYSEDRYDFNSLFEEFIGPLERKKRPKNTKKYKKKYKTSSKKVVKHFWTMFGYNTPERLRSLHYAYLCDLHKIAELRNYELKGHREYMCFLHRYWDLCVFGDPAEATKRMLDFYDSFAQIPGEEYSHDALMKYTYSAELGWREWLKDLRYGYNYSREKLIEVLKITDEEQSEMKVMIDDSERNRRKNKSDTERRRREGVLERSEYEKKRQDDKQNKIDELKRLLEEDPKAKRKDLAELLGVSGPRITQLKKEL